MKVIKKESIKNNLKIWKIDQMHNCFLNIIRSMTIILNQQQSLNTKEIANNFIKF